MRNSFEKGFLNKYLTGRKGEIICLELDFGALRLEYSKENGTLLFASFILDEQDQSSIGERLEFDFSTPDDPCVTFILENGVFGLQWRGGVVFWDNSYDESGEDKKLKVIKLETWVDECIKEMINPSEEILERYSFDNEEED